MSYGDQSANQAQAANGLVGGYKQITPQSPSLVRDSGQIADKLLELHSRIMKAGDTLCGVTPTPLSTGMTNESRQDPNSCVRRNLDTSSNWIARIEEAVTRIENAL